MATIPEALAIAAQHYHRRQLDIAAEVYRQILAVEPNQVDALHFFGVIAFQSGKHDIAIEYIRRAIELKGTDAAIHSNLGNVLQAQGKMDEAVACFRRALELQPDWAEAHYNLGNAFQVQEKLGEAVVAYRRALELKPGYVDAYNNLGNVLKAQGNLDAAVACFRRVLELKPDWAEAHSNLGNVFRDQEKLEEAIAAFRRALELNPDLPEVLNNLGNAYNDQGKIHAAIACCRRALELKPDLVEAHNNLGHALQQLRQFDDARTSYARAVELKADFPYAHYGKSTLELLIGDFESGWLNHEWRFKTKNCVERNFVQPRWDGDSLKERTILLCAEQGLGDTIQFVRYAGLVKRLNPAATVIVECQRSLKKLLARCPGIDRLFAQGDELPPFDVYLPLLSLPGVLKTSLHTIPTEVPYLHAEAALVDQWRERLAHVDGLRIGINWRGRPLTRRRDIPMECIGVLAGLPGVRLISLQKGEVRADLSATDGGCSGIVDLGADFDTVHGAFMDTAAVMMNVDLVISSDTAVPHLAGALGVPVWLAVPFVPDWRWLLDRSDSPWYPTIRLFRQETPGDWSGVFNQICEELRKLIALIR